MIGIRKYFSYHKKWMSKEDVHENSEFQINDDTISS